MSSSYVPRPQVKGGVRNFHITEKHKKRATEQRKISRTLAKAGPLICVSWKQQKNTEPLS